jgi:ssDNA thymidine ADP-ribosyltransferase, DarT
MTPAEFVKLLQNCALHRCFYHFTDTRNLALIRQHGLLSRAELNRRAIDIPAPGGNLWSIEADARRGMDAFVHLCFLSEHPMEYQARQDGRIQQSFFLQIKPEVILLPGVQMSPGVANKSGAVALPPEKMLPQLDLEVIYTKTDWKQKSVQERRMAAKKYELLVPTHVPTTFFMN